MRREQALGGHLRNGFHSAGPGKPSGALGKGVVTHFSAWNDDSSNCRE